MKKPKSLEEMLQHHLGQPSGSPDPLKHHAKLNVLNDLRDAASDMMGDGLHAGLNKVSVAAPDKEHLEEGLDKAKDMLDQSPDDESADDDMDADPDADQDPNSDEASEGEESPEEEQSEDQDPGMEDHMSPEEIEAKIQELQQLKMKKMHGLA